MKFKGCLSLSKCNLSTAQRVDCEKPDIIRSVFIKCFFFCYDSLTLLLVIHVQFTY